MSRVTCTCWFGEDYPLIAPNSVKDKHGDTPMAYLPDDDKEVKALIRKAQAQASVSNDDVANGALSTHTHLNLCLPLAV